jgi:hypothetical protein
MLGSQSELGIDAEFDRILIIFVIKGIVMFLGDERSSSPPLWSVKRSNQKIGSTERLLFKTTFSFLGLLERGLS